MAKKIIISIANEYADGSRGPGAAFVVKTVAKTERGLRAVARRSYAGTNPALCGLRAVSFEVGGRTYQW